MLLSRIALHYGIVRILYFTLYLIVRWARFYSDIIYLIHKADVYSTGALRAAQKLKSH